MSEDLILPMPAIEDMGPNLRGCTEMERRFVVAWFHCGGNRTRAAEMAGYAADAKGDHKQSAYQVWHREKVQRAIKEYAERSMLHGMLPLAFSAWREIVGDPGHKDRAKMTLAVLERTGFHAVTEHKVSVDSTSDRLAMLREIVRLAKATGQDWRNLLGAASDVTDADFQVVEREILMIEGPKTAEPDWENFDE